MPRGYLPQLLFLSALWGSSYLFIKIAVEELEPATMMALRLLLAALVLWAVLVWRSRPAGALAQVRATGPRVLVLAVINGVVPFWLIAWGEKHIDSGVAAVANSTVPIFVAILALRFKPSERARGLKLVGIVVGLGGVAVLAGVHPEGGAWAVLGTLAVVLASLSYAAANLFAQHYYPGAEPLALSTAAISAAGLIILPFGLLQLPDAVPSADALGSVAALGIVGTAVAYLVYYNIVTRYGAARTALVAYLLPAFALFYGVVFLDESLTLSALLGLALILVGVALGSGVVRRRSAEAAAP